MSAEVARALFTGGNSQVIRLDRGRCAILRFIGTNSQSLVDWLGQGLREFKGAVVVNARELSGIDATFVQLLLDPKSKELKIDTADDLIKGALLTQGGAVVHDAFKPAA